MMMLVAILSVSMVFVGGCSADEEPSEEPEVEVPSEVPAEDPEAEGPVTDVPDGEAALEGACTSCHDMTQIYSQPAGADWENILETMMTVHGIELAEPNQVAVLDYLESHGQ